MGFIEGLIIFRSVTQYLTEGDRRELGFVQAEG